jgi:hypothetical protein
MKKIVLKSIVSKNNGLLPIALDRDIYTYCKNAYLNSEYFEDLYGEVERESFIGQIVKIMESKEHFDVPMDKKMNFCIFTVINVSDDHIIDNPPVPPYVNISNLIYNLDIPNGGIKNEPDYVLLRKYFYEAMFRLKKFKFYQNLIADESRVPGETTLADLNKKYEMIKNESSVSFSQEEIVRMCKTLLELVSVNNEATLVGSLQSTEEIANIGFNKVVCSYNKDLDDVFKTFVQMPLNKFGNMENPRDVLDHLSIISK